MIDGIIQKVFSEFRPKTFREAKIVQDIEDKLIAEIKKKYQECGHHVMLSELIGDNEE